MHRQIGINVISLLPWSHGWFPLNSWHNIIGVALESGFDGIQALPLRGLPRHINQNLQKYVISYEDSWNNGPLVEALLRQIGLLGHPSPMLHDWLFFGPLKYRMRLDSSIKVVHDTKEQGVLEINPNFSTDPNVYHRFVAAGGKLCIDYAHLVEISRKGTRLPPWDKFLEQLPPEAIALIHVNAPSQDWQNFVTGKKSPLIDFLRVMRVMTKYSSVPAIVEIRPNRINLDYHNMEVFLNGVVSLVKFYLD